MEGPLYFSPELRGKRARSAVQEDEITGRVFGTLKAISYDTRMSILMKLDIIPSDVGEVELELWPDLVDVEPDVLVFSKDAPVAAIECKWGLDPTAGQLAREARIEHKPKGFRVVLITRRMAPVGLEEKYLQENRDVPLILKRWDDVCESFRQQAASTKGLERSILDEAIAFMEWKGMRSWKECMGHLEEQMQDGRVYDALEKLHSFFYDSYKQLPRMLGTNFKDMRKPHYGYTDRSWFVMRPKILRQVVKHLRVYLSYTPYEPSWELTLEIRPKDQVKQLVRALSKMRLKEMELNILLEENWIVSREVDGCVDYARPERMMKCFADEIKRFNNDVIALLKRSKR
ncbi:MAG: hypothetical protein ACE5KV_04425 [Thermoplasmata archaeon]